jgi:hypothetical protein
MEMKVLSTAELPCGFVYPDSFLKAIRLELTNLEPWYIMNSTDAQMRIKGMQTRYPQRVLIPFARRGDNDDVACFQMDKDQEIQIIHDFASVGYEQRRTYTTFWDWFRAAMEEMIQFD